MSINANKSGANVSTNILEASWKKLVTAFSENVIHESRLSKTMARGNLAQPEATNNKIRLLSIRTGVSIENGFLPFLIIISHKENGRLAVTSLPTATLLGKCDSTAVNTVILELRS